MEDKGIWNSNWPHEYATVCKEGWNLGVMLTLFLTQEKICRLTGSTRILSRLIWVISDLMSSLLHFVISQNIGLGQGWIEVLLEWYDEGSMET